MEVRCIQSVKDTKFKAIHNLILLIIIIKEVVFNLSKIQNLKRFTTIQVPERQRYSCIQSVKDTKFKAIHNIEEMNEENQEVVFNLSKIQNLKRFTTSSWMKWVQLLLYSICQRYKI